MQCRICGKDGTGLPFQEWVRPTFTDHDKLVPGEIICDGCLFWFDEQSEGLARLVGKEKPQRMRNYSHFIVNGKWIPLSKGDKRRMQGLLLSMPFPELAVIAESGQKHIAFRARRNLPDAKAGWVQFEEQVLFVHPDELGELLHIVESLYIKFSKAEIGTGNYKQYRIRDFGLHQWYELESQIAPKRNNLLFNLVLFLAQKEKEDDTKTRTGSDATDSTMAGSAERLQESLSAHDLETVRGQCEKRSIHEQPGQIHQLNLFQVASTNQDRR